MIPVITEKQMKYKSTHAALIRPHREKKAKDDQQEIVASLPASSSSSSAVLPQGRTHKKGLFHYKGKEKPKRE